MRPADVERKVLAILRVLAEWGEPVGAKLISQSLKSHGVELSERAVRYHLKMMDERGLTRSLGESGRDLPERLYHGDLRGQRSRDVMATHILSPAM